MLHTQTHPHTYHAPIYTHCTETHSNYTPNNSHTPLHTPNQTLSLSLVDTLTHESMTHTLIHTYMTHTCCLSIDIERVVDIWREREKERDRKREKEEEREKERERNVAPSQPIRKYD